VRGELGDRPFVTGVFVVGQNGDALGLKFGEKIWRVTFAIKDKSKSRQKWIGGQRFSASEASATSRGTMLWRNTAIRPGLTGWVRTKNGAPP
jgi:hypothetical protein